MLRTPSGSFLRAFLSLSRKSPEVLTVECLKHSELEPEPPQYPDAQATSDRQEPLFQDQEFCQKGPTLQILSPAKQAPPHRKVGTHNDEMVDHIQSAQRGEMESCGFRWEDNGRGHVGSSISWPSGRIIGTSGHRPPLQSESPPG